MTNCGGKSFPPQARVDIHASIANQAIVMEAMKSFGARSGFKVLVQNDLPKQGRFVSQVTIQRNDGVVISMSNFMKADTLQTFFYAEKPSADWRSAKSAWMREMKLVVPGEGNIIEVPQ